VHNHGFALVRQLLTILSRPSSLIADRATVRSGGIYPSATYGRSWPEPATSPSEDAFEYDVRDEAKNNHSAHDPRNLLSAGSWIISGYSDHGLPTDSCFTAIESPGDDISAASH
jgi:hypothetical protein